MPRPIPIWGIISKYPNGLARISHDPREIVNRMSGGVDRNVTPTWGKWGVGCRLGRFQKDLLNLERFR